MGFGDWPNKQFPMGKVFNLFEYFNTYLLQNNFIIL